MRVDAIKGLDFSQKKKKNVQPFFPLTGKHNQHLKLRKSKYPLEESTQTLEKVTDNDNLLGRKRRSGTAAGRNNPQRGKYALLPS